MPDHSRLALRALLFVALFATGLHVAADDAPDVRKLMTAEEYEAAGLGRLSPAEIEALNKWVLRYTVGEAPAQRRANPVVREEIKKMDDVVVRTRIAGSFAGWSGHTVFRLENGQVWKQRIDGKFRFIADSPEVEIEKNLLGFWMLRLVEKDRAIGVTRLE